MFGRRIVITADKIVVTRSLKGPTRICCFAERIPSNGTRDKWRKLSKLQSLHLQKSNSLKNFSGEKSETNFWELKTCLHKLHLSEETKSCRPTAPSIWYCSRTSRMNSNQETDFVLDYYVNLLMIRPSSFINWKKVKRKDVGCRFSGAGESFEFESPFLYFSKLWDSSLQPTLALLLLFSNKARSINWHSSPVQRRFSVSKVAVPCIVFRMTYHYTEWYQ